MSFKKIFYIIFVCTVLFYSEAVYAWNTSTNQAQITLYRPTPSGYSLSPVSYYAGFNVSQVPKQVTGVANGHAYTVNQVCVLPYYDRDSYNGSGGDIVFGFTANLNTATISFSPTFACQSLPEDGVGTASYSFSLPLGEHTVGTLVVLGYGSTIGTLAIESTIAQDFTPIPVSVVSTLPPIVLFYSNKTSALLGDFTTLTWGTARATNCTASGDWSGPKATTTTAQVLPAYTTAGTYTYNLSCTGAGGTTVATPKVVTVATPVPPTATIISPTAATLIVSGGGVPFIGTGTGSIIPGSSSPSTIVYSCPVGATLIGTNCQAASVSATAGTVSSPSFVVGMLWGPTQTELNRACDLQGYVGGTGVIESITCRPNTGCADTFVRMYCNSTSYSCPVGYTLSGTICNAPLTPPATTTSSCPVGYTLSGTNCVLVSTITAYEWCSGTCSTGTVLNTNSSFNFSTTTVTTHSIYFRVKDSLNNWSTNNPFINVTVTSSCANGATVASSCTVCPTGQAYYGGYCGYCTDGCDGAGDIDGNGATCNNFALNPPLCSVCPGDQDLDTGVCATTPPVSLIGNNVCDAGETITDEPIACKPKTRFWQF